MKPQRRTNSISKVTNALLLQGESEVADFKRTPEGVSADDLVAFANSASGGTILVGVDEHTGADGVQHGVVRGCSVDDTAVLQILNKAVSCVPPVGVVVHIENLKDKPILRLVIPSSESKPHCTPKGVYCRRDGSRNRALHPAELLNIFLETEARAFATRFESAAEKIAKDLRDLEMTLDSSIRSMGDQLGWAESHLGDTESTLGTILAYTHTIKDQTQDSAIRLRTLFRQDKREDPVRAAVRKEFIDQVVKQLVGDRPLLDKIRQGAAVSINRTSKTARELDEEDFRNLLTEAATIATNKLETEKYTVEVKPPSKATEDELNNFAVLVKDGGEVVDGLRQRLESALVLGFLKYEGSIVGTAALKKPALNYRSKVFEKAKSDQPADAYPLELGWVYLVPKHRGKKRMPSLVGAVVKRADKVGMFATTRTLNSKMLSLLTRQGFARDGLTYPSTQTPGEELALFLRPPKASPKAPDSKD